MVISEMTMEKYHVRKVGRCLLLSSVAAMLLLVTVISTSDSADAGLGPKSVWGFVKDYEGDPIPDILVTVNIRDAEYAIRSTLQDTTGPGDSTPAGFYTVTFPNDQWYAGDTVEVVVSYSGDQEIETKLIAGEGDEEVNIQFEYAIPQFGSMLGFAIAAGLVAVVAMFALRRKKSTGP
jgi:hypothetical protein